MNGFAKVCGLMLIISENSFNYSEFIAIVNIILRLIEQYFTILRSCQARQANLARKNKIAPFFLINDLKTKSCILLERQDNIQ